MRRGPWITRPLVGALLAVLAGCSAGVAPGPSLPTFPGSDTPSPGGAAAAHDVGVLPDDCSRVLPVPELIAVLGLPLDSVVVHTTNGVPVHSVGRIERIDCTYRGTATAGRDSDKPVLAVHAAAYATAAAAHAQWLLNAAEEDGRHQDLPVGVAAGVLVERPGEALLSVQYGSGTLGLSLPGSPFPDDRTPADLLVDLARRVLPVMAATAPAGATAVGAAPTGTASFTTSSSASPGLPSVPPSAPLRASGTG